MNPPLWFSFINYSTPATLQKPEFAKTIQQSAEEMTLDSWSFRPSFPESLFNNNFTENEALTNALLTSLSDSSNSGSPVEIRPAPRPEPASRNPLSGRIAKRKSRASKKSPTTYIAADPENFRQMVQQVTGVRCGEAGRVLPAEGLVPTLKGFGPIGVDGGMLPTLDRSAGLLGRVGGFGSEGSRSGFGFDAGLCFPTLESWGAM